MAGSQLNRLSFGCNGVAGIRGIVIAQNFAKDRQSNISFMPSTEALGYYTDDKTLLIETYGIKKRVLNGY